MPYIITTYQPDGFPDHTMPDLLPANRTAVATLDEARAEVRATATPRLPLGRGTEADMWANGLPESGGTVGPLPDGTVIEVRRVDRFELGFAAGLIAADHPQLWKDADLVAKYNRTGRFADDPAHA